MKPKFTDTHRFRAPYKASHDTDIRKTLDRVRREQEEAASKAAANLAEAKVKVEHLPQRKPK
jgi:hypothetical protein